MKVYVPVLGCNRSEKAYVNANDAIKVLLAEILQRGLIERDGMITINNDDNWIDVLELVE